MILVDANLLLYAEDAAGTFHDPARRWWDRQLSAREPVAVCWPVLLAFLRLSTNPRAFHRPLTIEQAATKVNTWLAQPPVRLIHPTPRHWDVLRPLLERVSATANLVSDAHLAALAIEHDCELFSSDGDFALFPGLRWRNPLSPPGR